VAKTFPPEIFDDGVYAGIDIDAVEVSKDTGFFTRRSFSVGLLRKLSGP
jgi:hypothetical protein